MIWRKWWPKWVCYQKLANIMRKPRLVGFHCTEIWSDDNGSKSIKLADPKLNYYDYYPELILVDTKFCVNPWIKNVFKGNVKSRFEWNFVNFDQIINKIVNKEMQFDISSSEWSSKRHFKWPICDAVVKISSNKIKNYLDLFLIQSISRIKLLIFIDYLIVVFFLAAQLFLR